MTTPVQQRPRVPSPKYLSRPIPVEMEENDGNGRAWLKLAGEWVKIASIKNLWEIDGYREGEQPVIRMHFRVTTEDGKQVLLFQDLLEGTWYQEFTLGHRGYTTHRYPAGLTDSLSSNSGCALADGANTARVAVASIARAKNRFILSASAGFH